MDIITVAAAAGILLVILVGIVIYERWLKKEGYDQGDLGYEVFLKIVTAVATLVAPLNPGLSNMLISGANALKALWIDPNASTAELAAKKREVEGLIAQAQDVLAGNNAGGA